MPQLSLYLNDAAMARLRTDCKKANRSLSSYVSDLITSQDKDASWPQGYWDSVYGSLTDDSFRLPDELDEQLDGPLPSYR